MCREYTVPASSAGVYGLCGCARDVQTQQHWRRARSHSKRLELPDEWGGNWMAGEVNQSKSCDLNIL